MDTVADLWENMDVIPAGPSGDPALVIVPARIWNRVPGALRDGVRGLLGVLGAVEDGRPREVKAWLVPVAHYSEIVDAVEDAIDLDIAESADGEIARDRAARRRVGAEPGIPIEVVRAELDGVHPIAAWRKHRGKTQAELAGEIGIARGYLALLERRARDGSPETLSKIARLLGCLVEDLLEEDD
jgi:DNA-binding XRE family transcriptional regulator